MSTVILSRTHFHLIQISLLNYATFGRYSHSSTELASALCRSLGVEVFSDAAEPVAEKIRTLVFIWGRLNQRSYNLRHGCRDRNPVTLRLSKARSCKPALGVAALLKALRAVHCNIDEGRFVFKDAQDRDAHKILEKVNTALMNYMVSSDDAYCRACWFL